jgi:hypothetical protein
MPHDVVLGPIYAALKVLLAAYAPLTALISTKPLGGAPAIYDDGAVLQDATMPYLTIGAGTQVPDHTMGEDGLARFGWNCTLQIKAVSEGSEASGLAIMYQVFVALKSGTPLTHAGYTRAWCEEITLHPTIVTEQAGVTTREWPAILRVIASDT